MRKIILFIATGAGIGYVKRFPGTLGTCLAIPCSLVLNQLAIHTLYGGVFVLVGFAAFAIWVSGKAAMFLVRKDPQIIVIDEIAGFLIANFFNQQKLSSVALAFVLFRFFDIVKLFPAAKAEELPGGFGIVLDDAVAGVYTFAILHILTHWSFA